MFVRESWYDFSPEIINYYFNTPTHEDAFVADMDLIAKDLTHTHNSTWPEGDVKSRFLTSVYSVLLRIAVCNWLPTLSGHMVPKRMVVLLFKIRHRIAFNLGELIHSHIIAFTHKREKKIRLPFPNLIYGILHKQGFQLYPDEEVIAVDSCSIVDKRLHQGLHVDDCDSLRLLSVPHSVANRVSTTLTLAVLHHQVQRSQSLLSHIHSSISSLQAAIAQVNQDIMANLMAISRLESVGTSDSAPVSTPFYTSVSTPTI